MNVLLWVLQALAALVYGASGVMKVFMFDKASEGAPSFGALPRGAWTALGILELVCTVGLIVPAACHRKRRAGAPHGVHHVRPDGPEADLLNGGPAPIGDVPAGREHDPEIAFT